VCHISCSTQMSQFKFCSTLELGGNCLELGGIHIKEHSPGLHVMPGLPDTCELEVQAKDLHAKVEACLWICDIHGRVA
jgi:hypothetical protein